VPDLPVGTNVGAARKQKSWRARVSTGRGFDLANTPPDGPPLNSAQHQLAFIRRERDKLARQIQESKETIAKSQALIERLDHLLANLGSKP
jgi:hypothetical protein